MSAAAFGRKHGVGHQSLRNWAKAADAARRPEPGTETGMVEFVEVELGASNGKVDTTSSRSVAAELDLPHGIRIRIFEPSATGRR